MYQDHQRSGGVPVLMQNREQAVPGAVVQRQLDPPRGPGCKVVPGPHNEVPKGLQIATQPGEAGYEVGQVEGHCEVLVTGAREPLKARGANGSTTRSPRTPTSQGPGPLEPRIRIVSLGASDREVALACDLARRSSSLRATSM